MPTYETSLNGKTALVTGGGQGLGAAITRRLVQAGANVVIADIQAGPATELAAELGNGRTRVVVMDVADEEQVRAGIEQAVHAFGRLDILVNNAGIDRTCTLEALEYQDWDRILRTNLYGPYLLSRLAARHMSLDGQGGQIVNIASTAARRAWPQASAYHASKWGLLGFSQALHAELRSLGIKVSSVLAGGMRTPFLLERFPDLDPQLLQDPATVADSVCYLLSLPPESVVAEIMILPMRETSWP